MSKANFDPRDRADARQFPDKFDGKIWTTRAADMARLRLMARSGGYVMVRKSRAMPFVLTEKEWARLPLFSPDKDTKHGK